MESIQIKEIELIEDDFTVSSSFEKSLILYNDDYHTFDYVIKALMEICKHDFIQAEQCAYLVHYQGRNDVKKGNMKILKPMKQGLLERDLKASIE